MKSNSPCAGASAAKSPSTSVMFARPSASIVRRPASSARGEMSQPTKRAAGSDTAIGMRLEPSLHPTSSTLQRSTPGRACPTERRDRREPAGMRCRMRQRVVRNLVVAARECGVRRVDADRHRESLPATTLQRSRQEALVSHGAPDARTPRAAEAAR